MTRINSSLIILSNAETLNIFCLRTGADFKNILLVDFVLISLRQKIANTNYKQIKASKKTFVAKKESVYKMLSVKSIPGFPRYMQ